MQTPTADWRALQQTAAAALQRGETARARDLFSQAVATGQAGVSVWLGLAFACRKLGDNEGKARAVDKVLEAEPRNAWALILKGDDLAAANDTRAATAYYSAAIKAASSAPQLSAELREELRRAHALRERYAKDYEEYLHDHLARRGFGDGSASRRFAHSLDLLLGKKQVFLQEPLHYYFPELPQIQFYERRDFPWLDAVEAATDDIRGELLEVLKLEGAFSPYIEADPARPPVDHHMVNSPEWTAFYLWKGGILVKENAARCPKTIAAIKDVPLTQIKNRCPSVLFSALRPGAHIPPHTGHINVRLICHLPLIVPGKCQFRVGNDVRLWEEGNAWVFDDTIQHEAWNGSDKLRVILIFDIWRPELSQEERALVAAMFEAIDSYGGQSVEWHV
ncbi:MAG: aspartyl/asparaginyl beta-hydroxylase domain-containing protein [Alphaproteobacteria bacterium]